MVNNTKKFSGKIRTGGKVAIITVPKQIMLYECLEVGDVVNISIEKAGGERNV